MRTMQNFDQKKLLHWAPRILAIIGILFLSLFALDVFTEYDRIGEIAVAFFIHLIPSYFLIAATLIAWRWKMTGGLLFLALSLVSVFFFRTYEHIITFMILSMPLFIVGWLFIWDGMSNDEPPRHEVDRANPA